MKKLFTTFVYLLFVSFLYSQVTLDDVSEAKQFNKTTLKNNRPNSSNWISFSSGFSKNLDTEERYLPAFILSSDRSSLISELTYSHRYFLNSNNSLSFDGGILFDYGKISYITDSNFYIPPYFYSNSEMNISSCFRILYNYHSERFSINTGFGTGLISFARYSYSEDDDIYRSNFLFIDVENRIRNEFFGIIGLNIELNKNNELGIRTYYQLLNESSLLYYGKRVTFQLKYNHRL